MALGGEGKRMLRSDSDFDTARADYDVKEKKRMLAAFIYSRKAYDRVDRSKLWDCLEGAGLKQRLVNFLRAVYWGV